MRKKEKVATILKILEGLFPSPEIPLNHTDPYTLLIAVLLSAQCTDARVNKVTPELFKLASNPQEMSLLPPATIQQIIRTCGLSNTKAQAIHQLSKILVEKYAGQVPATFHDLESLPGVGHKTASVVMVQAFNHPAFPVDTHIHRLAKRWGLSSGRSVVQTEKDLKRIFPEKTWNKLHLQMIYFARTYCPALKHQKERCPICSLL
jgi:endonuclease-3